MALKLDGKVAIVTGSTQGLGAAVARRLLAAGARVVLSGRKVADGERLAAELGPAAVFHATELSHPDECSGLVAKAIRAFGGVDIVINSAAVTSRSTLETFTVQQFDEQFAVNVRAPLLVAQAALESLRARTGVIINIGSVNGYVGGANLLLYSATKGALMTASKNLANALAHTRVRVFCLNVGWMDTEGERAVLAQEGLPADFIEKQGASMPLGRILRPEEIAEWCLFLCEPDRAAFSGAVIDLEQFPLGALSYPTTPSP